MCPCRMGEPDFLMRHSWMACLFDNTLSSSPPLSHRLHDKLPLLFHPPIFFLHSCLLNVNQRWKLQIFFPFISFFFIVWIESNKDSFLFDVIKLLRPDLGVKVNFFPKHRRELSDFRCQTLFQASQHLVFPPQVKGRFEEEEKKTKKTHPYLSSLPDTFTSTASLD